MASATKIQPLSADKSATALERLHADRARVAGELAVLSASSARLRGTANAEAAVVREIGEMGNADIAAMTAWASAGCIGDPPAPDLKQRRAIAEKLAAVQAAAAAAKGAGQDIDYQIGQLNEELATLSRQIDAAALDAMQAEFMEIHGQHRIAVESLRTLTAKLTGLCSHFTEQGRHLIDVGGNREAGQRYFARAEALNTVKLTDPGLTHLEMLEGASFWANRAAALSKGSAS
jgi:hypothetical protein